jgi:hypothetical protein
MAIVRPTANTGSGTGFLGFQTVAINSIVDKASNYDWADVYLEVEVQSEKSKFPNRLRITGSFDRDASGDIVESSLLKRIYYLFDAIGFEGGVDLQGNFVNAEEEKIEDIASFLSTKFADSNKYSYAVYVYKEPDKKQPGKAWTRVQNKIVKADEMVQLKDYIRFMKEKNFIKEVDPNAPAPGPDLNIVSQDTSDVPF